MPGTGFGHGPFGHHPFGEWPWSKHVLYDLLPILYRQEDPNNDYLLLKWAEANRPLFDNLRRKIRALGDLRDPSFVRTNYDEVTDLRLGPVVSPKGALTQRGIRGVVTTLREFTSAYARFTQSDQGRELEIRYSAVPANNRTVLISAVIDPTTITTNPPLQTDLGGTINWVVREKAVVPSDRVSIEVWGGAVEDIAPGWTLTDGDSKFTVIGRTQYREATDSKLFTEKEASDGVFTTVGGNVVFLSPTAGFTQADHGKRLSVPAAVNLVNAGQFEVLAVVDPSTLVGPYVGWTGVRLASTNVDEAGPLYWALLPRPIITLRGTAIPEGVIEQYGYDGQVTVSGATSTIVMASGKFTSADVGKRVYAHGFAASITPLVGTVSAVVNATTLQVSAVFPISSGLGWQLRTSTALGNGTVVRANAASLLQYLAQDFGITIEDEENETRQREWVKHVTDWTNKKGTAEAYAILAALSGYSVVTDQLFRIDTAWVPAISPLFLVWEPEPFAGFAGTNGTLSVVDGFIRLHDASASFTSGVIGLNVKITGSSTSANNKTYTVEAVVDTQTLRFRYADYDLSAQSALESTPETGLTWEVGRLFSRRPPAFPNYDEVNIEKMQAYQGDSAFHADKACWEPDFKAEFFTFIGAAPTTISDGLYSVTATAVTKLPYRDQTVAFVNGGTVTGGTSGATATLVAHQDIDTSGTLFVVVLGGTFVAGETITCSTGGSATVHTPPRLGELDIILYAGKWKLVDSTGTEFFLETVPTVGGVFQVAATVPPATGFARFVYDCSALSAINCAFCPASSVYVESAAESADIDHAAFEARLDQVTPAHVRKAYKVLSAPFSAWESAGNLPVPRSRLGGTKLADGSLLVFGGWDGTTDRTEAQRISSTGTVLATTSLLGSMTASCLVTNGAGDRVLVTGGLAYDPSTVATGVCSLYLPESNTWSATAAMANVSAWHTLTRLYSGRAIRTGGKNVTGNAYTTVEEFNPYAGTWTALTSMSQGRFGHQAVLFDDGRLMVMGGALSDFVTNCTATCALYDRNTNSWTSLASMNVPRCFFAALKLQDGRVFVYGGYSNNAVPVASAEIYDPDTNRWTLVAASTVGRAWIAQGHGYHLMEDGNVIVMGGQDGSTVGFPHGATASVQVFNVRHGKWVNGPALPVPRMEFASAYIEGATFMVVGGVSGIPGSSPTFQAPILISSAT